MQKDKPFVIELVSGWGKGDRVSVVHGDFESARAKILDTSILYPDSLFRLIDRNGCIAMHAKNGEIR